MEEDDEVIELLNQIPDPQDVSYSIVDEYVILDSDKIDSDKIIEFDDVQKLLNEWNLIELYPKFKEEAITIDVLKVIRPEHVEKLMRGYKLGTQVSFGYNLNNWRNSIAAPSFYNENVLPNMESPTLSPTISKSSSTCSTPDPEKSTVSLACVLNESNAGTDLVNYYDRHNEFNDKHRISLINAIAEYYTNKKVSLSLRDTYSLERQIVERFPSEKIDFYRTSKRGRIYNKFSNLKHTKKLLFHPISLLEDSAAQPCLVIEENVEEIVKRIKHDNLSVEEFENFWKACSRHRLNYIKNSKNTLQIFEKWPEYKSPKGYRLIDIDFKVMFPTASSILDTWESIQGSFFHVLKNEDFLNNKDIKENLSDFDLLSQNGKEAVLLWASHGCLGPSQRSVKKTETGKNHVTRFSIKDSQNAFLLINGNAETIEETIRHKLSLQESIQPFIFVIGENVKSFSEIYIYFDGVKYPTKSFIRAVDVCFKIFYLFDLEYPQQCSIFWKFIASLFFKMNLKESNTKISVLCSAITKHMKT